MKRDAQATRTRILDAATAEFSRYGLAGARIDRIAAASGSNKAMIYTYFGSKDGLMEAVGSALMTWHLQEVPFDPSDLPAYAARVFDRYQRHPELIRLVTWDRLERGPDGAVTSPAALATLSAKIAALQQAQEEGVVSRRFPATVLLELIVALTEVRPLTADALDEAAHGARTQAIKDAVAALTQQTS